MDKITAKFGGTSLADAAHFRRVREILAGNLARRFVVVSAPGKRSGQDVKITDLLYDCHQAARAGGDVASAFAPVEVRFREILAGLNLNLDLSEEFRATQWAMERGAGQAFCVSRGEYFSGRIMAALLGLPFIDPAQCVFFDEHGQFDGEAAQRTLQEKLQGLPGAVMPGFYGGMPDGAVATFARGGSDISGAILARASGSAVYENWTDVSGVLAADPRVVENPAPIGCMTYTEVRELAYLGATVLHEDAIYPAKVAGIPIHICNTMAPGDGGTWIIARQDGPAGDITGLAGRRGYSAIQVEKERSNTEVGYCRKILSCLEKNGVPFEHLATGIGSVSLVAPTALLDRHRQSLLADIQAAVHPDSLQILDNLAMIAVVGRGMAGRPQVAARLFSAVGEAGVNVRLIDQGTKELNIVLGVDEADYQRATNAIYNRFFAGKRKEN